MLHRETNECVGVRSDDAMGTARGVSVHPCKRLSIARMQRPTGPRSIRIFGRARARANLAFKIVYFIVGRVRKSDFYESMMRQSILPPLISRCVKIDRCCHVCTGFWGMKLFKIRRVKKRESEREIELNLHL